MKSLPAKHIIDLGIKTGSINKKTIIVESSSGSLALGIGLICAEENLRFKIFSDTAIDHNLKNQLKLLGGEVIIIKGKSDSDSLQIQRLVALKKYIEETSNVLWMKQYDNVANQEAYAIVAEQLMLCFPNQKIGLVGSVGSGGSTCGIIKKLRHYNKAVQLIGVDVFGSTLFGLENASRQLRGLGNCIMPKNLIHEYYDEVHWINANTAYHHTIELYKHYALFMGPTTGAAFVVARWLANKHPKTNWIFTGPDEGYRYQDTIYNPEWYEQQTHDLTSLATQPSYVNNPQFATPPWSAIHWDRRTISDVLGNVNETSCTKNCIY